MKDFSATLCLAAFLDTGFGFGFGPFDVAARRQALVTQNTQGFDFRTGASAAEFQNLDVTWAGHAVFIQHFVLGGFGAP